MVLVELLAAFASSTQCVVGGAGADPAVSNAESLASGGQETLMLTRMHAWRHPEVAGCWDVLPGRPAWKS